MSTSSVEQVNFYRLPHWALLVSCFWLGPANRKCGCETGDQVDGEVGTITLPCFFMVWAVDAAGFFSAPLAFGAE